MSTSPHSVCNVSMRWAKRISVYAGLGSTRYKVLGDASTPLVLEAGTTVKPGVGKVRVRDSAQPSSRHTHISRTPSRTAQHCQKANPQWMFRRGKSGEICCRASERSCWICMDWPCREASTRRELYPAPSKFDTT